MDERREKGLRLFSEIMGPQAAERMKAAAESDGYLSESARLALDFAFGAVWTRGGLDRKQRSLVTMGILIGLRQYKELQNHVRIAIRNGLTAREIEETVIQAIPYAGFPAVASAMAPVIETLRELGIETEAQTPEERGML